MIFIAPPGYYMLFFFYRINRKVIQEKKEIPSEAKIIKLELA
jgi:hypothetical protein